MRIVIDMQGAQASSRYRGIGRYVLALSKAMVATRGEHEVLLAANGAFADAVEAIRAEYDGLLPPEAIRVWMPPQPCRALEVANDPRRLAAEYLYETFLANLKPDVVLIGSLFEIWVDDVATSIKQVTASPTAVILYDLIPLIYRDIYLSNPDVSRWYQQKLDHLRRADLLLSISASSGREAVDHLAFLPDQVVNIGTACDARFQPLGLSHEQRQDLAQRYGLVRPYVMYTGGMDHRKNIEGLIRAYALLPQTIRRQHQLAVVCAAGEADRQRLMALAREQGLAQDEFVMTGFVPDDDLVALYNGCALFVFPSWHEGFGLPALEAMACGAPTIAANTSSLPEVIGLDEALFDPRDEADIARLMTRALQDEDFRSNLIQHAPRQAAKFSWDITAQRAWRALEDLVAKQPSQRCASRVQSARPRLAYLSPVPLAKSGIADYSAELLPELARHYRIDLIVAQNEPVEDAWIRANARVRDIAWFRAHHREYDRVLYHFGNSSFHSHIFDLLEEIPGVVVLHDFFLSGILSNREVTGEAPGFWSRALHAAHGWPAVVERFKAKNTADVIWKYPCNSKVLQNALGVIVHSERSRALAQEWYGEDAAKNWAVIPLLRVPYNAHSGEGILDARKRARQALGIAEDEFVVCSFGHLGPTKLNHRLLSAWQASSLAQNPRCQLVFVGQNEGGEYGQQLVQDIKRTGTRARITGFVEAKTYQQWLLAAAVAVQLRTLSHGETSGAVLDCWNYGVPTVVNAHGAFAELPDDTVFKLPDLFSDEELAEAIETLYQQPERRAELARRGRQRILEKHHPRLCAERYAAAIEEAYARAACSEWAIIDALQQSGVEISAQDQLTIANALAVSFAPSPRRIQWLLDCSELVQRDAKSGIQRVTRALLREFLLHPPAGVQVEPVYAIPGQRGYHYARKFTCRLLEIPDHWCEDEPVEAWAGDVFLALDLQPHVLPEQQAWLQTLRTRGITVLTVVYDLLPLLLPSTFVEGAAASHQRWLEAVASFDGAITISRAVADELLQWLAAHSNPSRRRPFEVYWFHLGADIENSLPTQGIPAGGEQLLARLSAQPTFLMVGTVEPRKGHAQVLDAFELIWQKGADINLVIVGKQGWMVEALVERLRQHSELNKRLFWLEDISDEYLEKVYAASSCLIAASYGEGFGLPLIEAAQHKLPIIARDIPVFREVAGSHAAYFDAKGNASTLAATIKRWLADYRRGTYPRSTDMPWLTWAQSAETIKSILLGKAEPYQRWLPVISHPDAQTIN